MTIDTDWRASPTLSSRQVCRLIGHPSTDSSCSDLEVLGLYSNLRFYCPLNGGLGALAVPHPQQSPPTDNTRQGILLGIHLLKQMDTQDPHANHFGYFQLAVPLARVSEISSFISWHPFAKANGYARPSRQSFRQFSSHCFAG